MHPKLHLGQCHAGCCRRYGGHEFAALLPRVTCTTGSHEISLTRRDVSWSGGLCQDDASLCEISQSVVYEHAAFVSSMYVTRTHRRMSATALDPCSGQSWSPITAAGAQSVLSGVLAGFMFLGMVAIWTATAPAAGDDGQWPRNRSHALQLFATGFVIFAIDSYLCSITSGELSCNRAEVEIAFSGGVLGIGAVVMLTGLAWLLMSMAERTDELVVILRWTLGGLALLILVMLGVSAQGIGQALLPNRWQGFVDWAPYIASGAVCLAVLSRGARTVWLRRPESVGKAVTWTCVFALGDGIISAILVGVVGAMPNTTWTNMTPLSVYAVVLACTIMPGLVLVVASRAAVSALMKTRPDLGFWKWLLRLAMRSAGVRLRVAAEADLAANDLESDATDS